MFNIDIPLSDMMHIGFLAGKVGSFLKFCKNHCQLELFSHSYSLAAIGNKPLLTSKPTTDTTLEPGYVNKIILAYVFIVLKRLSCSWSSTFNVLYFALYNICSFRFTLYLSYNNSFKIETLIFGFALISLSNFLAIRFVFAFIEW